MYLSFGLVFILPMKAIGPASWGLFATSQAILTIIFLVADRFALQIIVNFGVIEEQRKQATSTAVLLDTLFIGSCTFAIWLGRYDIGAFTAKPELAPVLALFPLVACAFWLRNFTLMVAQLHIDTRGRFIIDGAWIGATTLLLLHGHYAGWLVDEIDMMYITAASAGFSSLVGFLIYSSRIRFALSFPFSLFKRMVRFGVAQFGSAATTGFLAQGDVVLLASLVGDAAIVGNYDAAKKFFRGFEGIRDAVVLFVYPAVARLSAQHRSDELRVLIEKMIAFMAIVIVPIVLLVWILPIDQVFHWVFKGKYQLAPDLFRLLSFAALAIPFSMNNYVLLGMSQVRRLFLATAITVAIFVLISLIAVPLLGAKGQGLALVASFWVLGILSVVMVRKLTGISLRNVSGRWRDALEFVRALLRRAFGRRTSNHDL